MKSKAPDLLSTTTCFSLNPWHFSDQTLSILLDSLRQANVSIKNIYRSSTLLPRQVVGAETTSVSDYLWHAQINKDLQTKEGPNIMYKPSVRRLPVSGMKPWRYERLSASGCIPGSNCSPLPPKISLVFPWPTQRLWSTLLQLLGATPQ